MLLLLLPMVIAALRSPPPELKHITILPGFTGSVAIPLVSLIIIWGCAVAATLVPASGITFMPDVPETRLVPVVLYDPKDDINPKAPTVVPGMVDTATFDTVIPHGKVKVTQAFGESVLEVPLP